MGGERETVASQKVETETGPEIIGSVRYHESKSQVHFHDDANKLKVAIPVATWYKAWTNLLSSLPNEWHYADVENGTVLHITLALKKANPKKERPMPRLDALMHIEKIEVSDEFSKLNKFSVK
jgi:hypothetical protein